MASKMESSGLPERIQISESFKNALHRHFLEFRCTLREDNVKYFY